MSQIVTNGITSANETHNHFFLSQEFKPKIDVYKPLSYTMTTWDFPDIPVYACVFRLGHIYQANPSWSLYNY